MRKKLDYDYCSASPILEWLVPPKVEYYVSEFGETLIPHLEQLKQWGQENFEMIMENRRKNKY